MAKEPPDLLQGTLDLLILKSLQHEPMHGFGISVRIRQMSDEVLQVEQGSLYPALHRLLLKGWATSEWVQAGPKRRNRIYTITPEGSRQLDEEIIRYRRVAGAVARVLQEDSV